MLLKSDLAYYKAVHFHWLSTKQIEVTMTTLTINLPDNLAKEAQDAGLLDPEAIETMLRETLRRQHIEELRQSMEKMAAADIPPMTMEEIQAEIDAYRREVRRAAGT